MISERCILFARKAARCCTAARKSVQPWRGYEASERQRVRPCRRSLLCRTACLIRSVSGWTGFIGGAVDIDCDAKVEVGLLPFTDLVGVVKEGRVIVY